MTQLALAKRLDVSQSLIAKIESGTVQPSYEVARALLGFLDSELRQREGHFTVGQVLRRGVPWIEASDSLQAASAVLGRNAAPVLPVRRNGAMVGSISPQRINAVVGSSSDPKARWTDRVESAMEVPLPAVPEGLPLKAVGPLLRHAGALVVVREDQYVGFCDLRDLLNRMLEPGEAVGGKPRDASND
jgi:predicted transcriptional regulator